MKRAGIYAAQADPPSVNQESHLCGVDQCSIAVRPCGYAGYLQTKLLNAVSFDRN